MMNSKKIFFFLLVLMLSNFCSSQILSGIKVEKKTIHPKLESVLGELIEIVSQGDKGRLEKFLHQRKLKSKDNKITVIIEFELNKKVPEDKLKSYGVVIKGHYKNLWEVEMPLSGFLEVINFIPEITYIRLPLTPFPCAYVSEGVSKTWAAEYQSNNYKGEGVKVAIIDGGFDYLTEAKASGEIPSDVVTHDFTGTGIETSGRHGTAVAEIVHDMAPGAKLYLLKIGNSVHLGNARVYCRDNGIKIINHSMGWVNSNFYDGTGIICEIANKAREDGILWVNSAGNAARMHYEGTFTDTNGNNWHEFVEANDETININASAGQYISVFLTWDDWPNSGQNYDFYLLNSNYATVASSENPQSGTQPPTEAITYYVPTSGTYHLAVRKSNATGNHALEIYSFYHEVEHYVESSSLMAPADASGVVAVGAVRHTVWETGPQEYFSSQGPTNDGRVKPEVVGPDGVQNYCYGNFYGTSASSPHVAGAAALYLSRYNYTVDQLHSKLEGEAVDMGSPGKDNIYGSGRINLYSAWIYPWSTKGSFYSSPRVSQGVCYVGSDDGHLYAINTDSGVEKWKYFLGNGVNIRSSVAVYHDGNNNILYFGASNGSLYKIIDNGTPTVPSPWPVNLSSSAINSSPVITGDKTKIFVGADDGKIYGVSADGTALPNFPADPPDADAPIQCCAGIYADGILYVGDNSGRVYAIHPTTGSILRSRDLGTAIKGHISLRYNSATEVVTVYAGDAGTTNNGLSALDAANFTTLRGQYRISPNSSAISIEGGVWAEQVSNKIYFLSSNHTHFYCVADNGNASNCLSLVSNYPLSIDGYGLGVPLIWEGCAYFGTSNNKMYAVDVSGSEPTVKEYWPKACTSGITTCPAADRTNNLVVIATLEGRIYGFFK